MIHYPPHFLLAVEQAELSLSAEADGSSARLQDEAGLTGLAALILPTTGLPAQAQPVVYSRSSCGSAPGPSPFRRR